MNIANRTYEILGIVVAISLVFFVIIFSVLNLSIPKYDFFFVSTSHDISNSFSLIIGLITSPFIGALLALSIYKKQKTDAEIKERKRETTEKITNLSQKLQDIIEPFIENASSLRESYFSYQNSSGPYNIVEFEKKSRNLESVRRILTRYNMRPGPRDEFIDFVEIILSRAENHPQTDFWQGRTSLVVIIDCSDCQNILSNLEHLLQILHAERTRLNREIGYYSDSI